MDEVMINVPPCDPLPHQFPLRNNEGRGSEFRENMGSDKSATLYEVTSYMSILYESSHLEYSRLGRAVENMNDTTDTLLSLSKHSVTT